MAREIRTGEKSNKKEVTYKIIEECGTIGTRQTRNGTETVKVRYMSWNNGTPRYDIRPWYEDENGNEHSLKAGGLSGEELKTLIALFTDDDEPKAKQPRVAGAKRSRK